MRWSVPLVPLFLLLALPAGVAAAGDVATPDSVIQAYVANSYAVVAIAGIPAAHLPPGITGLLIVPVAEISGRFPAPHLIGRGPGGVMQYFGPLPFAGDFNPAKVETAYDTRTNLLRVSSQLPFSAFTHVAFYEWRPDPGQARVTRELDEDPSALKLAEARRWLAQGQLAAAGRALDEMFYPAHYYDAAAMAADFLVAAHRQAQRSQAGRRRGGDTAAVQWYQLAVEALPFFAGDTPWFLCFASRAEYDSSDYAPVLPFNRFIGIMRDYASSLKRSGQTGTAVSIYEYLLPLEPDPSSSRLNLGDLLWQLGRTEAARAHYRAYLAAARQPRHIPARVRQRLR